MFAEYSFYGELVLWTCRITECDGNNSIEIVVSIDRPTDCRLVSCGQGNENGCRHSNETNLFFDNCYEQLIAFV